MNEVFSMSLLGYKIRGRLKNFLMWSAVSLGLFILIIVMFSNLLSAGLPEFVSDLISSMPGADKDNVIETPDFKDFGVNFGVCMQLMLIVGCIYASYLGASAHSNGRGDSDVMFVYSLPVSRVCAVLTSFAAQFVTLILYDIVVTAVSLAVLYSNNKMEYLGKVMIAVAAFVLIELVYLSIAFLLATFMNSGSQAASISAVVVTLTIIFGIIGSMSKSLAVLKLLSPYSYVSMLGIVTGETGLYFVGIAAGLLITLLTLVISCMRYTRIDILID